MRGNSTDVPIRVGIIGCGVISAAYLRNLQRYKVLTTVACADMDMDRARGRAEEFSSVSASAVAELLADPTIELVVNLTNPLAHRDVSMAAISAGKHVYSEKPLATERGDGQAILEMASAMGVMVGCAPDTFLGGGIQTCRRLIDDGEIGEPIAATAFMTGHGHERWHPDPDFYYNRGGGPMFDMGPYYLTALLNMIGPVSRVCGSHRRTFPERTITSKPRYGEKISFEVSTHVAGILDFASGAIGTILTSFDIWGAQLPRIEIYGTKGSLSVPDPNTFGGPVKLLRAGESEWSEAPLMYPVGRRGIGVAEMAWALRSGRDCRASGETANHVQEGGRGPIGRAGGRIRGLVEGGRAEYAAPALVVSGLVE